MKRLWNMQSDQRCYSIIKIYSYWIAETIHEILKKFISLIINNDINEDEIGNIYLLYCIMIYG